MGALDLSIVVAYLAGTLWLGFALSGGQSTVHDYFTSRRRAPWGLVMASIVATETSTVTIVSLPGFAFGEGLTFLQLVLGYLVGRAFVVWLLLPSYFRGEYLTAYQVLSERFGTGVGRLASTIFLATRNLADGFRLFATGLVVAAALLTLPGTTALAASLFPSTPTATTVLIGSLLALSLTTIIYTSLGGMTAVLWTDLLQLTVYIGGAILAAIVLFNLIPGGWNEIVSTGASAGRLRVLDFSWDLSRSYTFWSGLIGGTCLTISTHGTDQLIVQRYLCSRTPRDAGRALLLSGVVILGQFLLFLIIGVMLYVYYTGHAPDAMVTLAAGGPIPSDRVFPTFIVTQLPNGLRGLLVAAIVAAAMSTLSSSLNASASTTLADFYMPATRRLHSPQHYLAVARGSTVVWGLVQLLVACVAIEFSQQVIDEVLGISSFGNGLILGIFLLGLAGYSRNATAYIGITAGAATMLAIRLLTGVSWQWYVLIGASATASAGWLADRIAARRLDV